MTKHPINDLFKSSSTLKTDRFINTSFAILLLLLMLIVLFSGGLFITQVMDKEENKLSQIITQVLAKSISKVSFSGKYHTRLLIQEIIKEQPTIKYLLVVNTQGIILAHSDLNKNGKLVTAENKQIIDNVLQNKSIKQIYTRHINYHNESIREVSLAYRGGYNNLIQGVIQVGLSTQSRDQSITQGIINLALLMLVLLLIGLLAIRYISSLIIYPIKELANDMAATLHAIPDLLFELDINGKYLQIMTNRDELLIDTRARLLNKTVFEALPPDAAKTMMQALQHADAQGEAYGYEIRLPINQTECWFELSIAKKLAFNQDKNISHFIVLSRNITQRKKDQQEINILAHVDTLTGLANRYSLENRLQQTLLSAQRDNKEIAIMFIDMDRFKDINDSLGHHIGDAFLIETARRLNSCVRKSDITGRLGGDEFIVILTDIHSSFNASHLATEILTSLSQPYQIKGHQIYSSGSIGLSYYPGDGETIDELMKSADLAMYHAKKEGRNNFQFFSSLMTIDTEKRIKLEADLRLAIEENQFELYYQPQISVISHKIIGAEALIRWNHPHKGQVSPFHFIPIAEESGLIHPIGNWVIEQAFKQKSLWLQLGIEGVKMSLNLSAHQLHSAGLVDFIQQLLKKYNLQGADIEIEITESVAMDNPQYAIEILNNIRALGINLAIDDFGTGYSSLAYLKRLPIQTLKIDREFIRDIETDSNDAAISSATIALAHSLGLQVVAEGVETAPQLEFLSQKKCDIIQGYFYSKPIPNKEFIQFYKDFT